MSNQDKEIELDSDACQRFERAVSVVAKSPPQHRTSSRPGESNPRGRPRAVDNKFLTVLVCVLAIFAGIGLMRWVRRREEKNRNRR
jgi:hypothetical protein